MSDDKSTAAEQLAELATVKQNRDTYQVRLVKATDLLSRCENLRAKWREQAHENGKRLADKERELATERAVSIKLNASTTLYQEKWKHNERELTAANAVVEELQRDCAAIGMRYSLKTVEALNEWRKLQGGDRDE